MGLQYTPSGHTMMMPATPPRMPSPGPAKLPPLVGSVRVEGREEEGNGHLGRSHVHLAPSMLSPQELDGRTTPAVRQGSMGSSLQDAGRAHQVVRYMKRDGSGNRCAPVLPERPARRPPSLPRGISEHQLAVRPVVTSVPPSIAPVGVPTAAASMWPHVESVERSMTPREQTEAKERWLRLARVHLEKERTMFDNGSFLRSLVQEARSVGLVPISSANPAANNPTRRTRGPQETRPKRTS
jgi:hypothetical protein